MPLYADNKDRGISEDTADSCAGGQVFQSHVRHRSVTVPPGLPWKRCAKHIVSAGIRRVVFLEPYPKSYAEELHGDSITFDRLEARKKVLFEPFIGISPRRYQDIFEKKQKRKDARGKARVWYEGDPMPRIEDKTTGYVENEESSIAASLIPLHH